MSELQQYYDEVACNSSTWNDEDPKKCGCLGSGWFLSQVDTWHKCSIHNKGQRHPEDYESEEELSADMEATRLEVFRSAPTLKDLAPVSDDDITF